MTQNEWLGFVTKKIQDKGAGYYMSWWLRIDTGIPTAKINYDLKKLVKRGLLLSKSNHYGIEYSLPTSTTPSISTTVTNTE